MEKRTYLTHTSIVIGVLGALFFSVSISFGETSSLIEEGKTIKAEIEEKKEERLKRIEREYDEYIKKVEERYEDSIQKKQQRISQLQEELESAFFDFDEQNQSSKENGQKAEEYSTKASQLEKQISLFDNKIATLEKRIQTLSQRVAIKENQIAILGKEKSKSQRAQDIQEEMILDYFRLYQIADEEFLEGKNIEKSLELLFTASSPSENVQEIAMLQEMERQSRKMFHMLDSTSSRIEESSKTIQKENKKILEIRSKIQEEKEELKKQKLAKRSLLLQAENSGVKYKKLWEKSVTQMEESAKTIKLIKSESQEINEELKKLERKKRFEQKILTKERLREKMVEELAEENSDLSVSELGKLFVFENSELAPLQWPIEPKKGISAYFKDEKYKKHFEVEHRAIDIPAPQGSDIASAAAGYVYKTADNGMGYSYIVLLHRDNIRTIYGHMSEISVKEGQMVKEGEIIGKSGGMPGTKGAGTMTTGPHLHFEVLEGEIHRNPLEYLALDALES